MAHQTGLRLRKWYLDVVSEDGRAFIGYWAAAHWRGVRVRYAGWLVSAAGAGTSQRWTLRAVAEPAAEGDGRFAWACPGLGFTAAWRGLDPGVERTLLEGEGGDVRWRCLMPRGRGEVVVAGERIAGLGYIEQLEMTARPWALPIDRLMWGRLLTETDGVVWIRWIGAEPKTVVMHNGRVVDGAEVEEGRVGWQDGGATLERRGTIRSGRLGATVLTWPGIRSLVPRRVLAVRESKWLSRGRLDGGGAGWAIHETVCLDGSEL